MGQLSRKWKKLSRRQKLTNLGLIVSSILLFSALSLRFKSVKAPEEIVLPTNADEVFSRTLQMRSVCANIPSIRHLNARLNGHRVFFIAEKYKLSYCRVTKTGSTFATQMFMTLVGIAPEFHDYGDAKTMFEVSRSVLNDAFKRNAALNMYADDKRVQLTTSFLIARNPYSRLFSTYIDYIYLPYKWSDAAKMVSEPRRRECGNDVKFNEFLETIADSTLAKRQIDIRWAPIFSLCLPCETHIDVIVKEETFAQDLDFVMGYTGVEQSTRELIYMAAQARVPTETVKELIQTYVTKGHMATRGCMSDTDLARKIWTSFQIKGYIHDDVEFPEGNFEGVLRDDLEILLLSAVVDGMSERPLTEAEAEIQKREWRLKFWKQIDSETMKKIQGAFYEDFTLFQYDIDPNNM